MVISKFVYVNQLFMKKKIKCYFLYGLYNKYKYDKYGFYIVL